MNKIERSPAKQSYIQQKGFHQRSVAGDIRAALACALPRRLRQRLRLRRRLEIAGEFALDGVDLVLGRRKELVPPRHLNFVGHGDFESIGDEFFRYFVEFGGLTPGGRMLEIGSGIGRMARPLTNYLSKRTYDGIDIVPKGVRWCERNISTRFSNFKFHLADIYNLAYNPRGTLQSLQYRFPFPDEHFDFAALTSVFSHMLKPDMEHYLRETARTLRQNGTALITFFFLNNESRGLIEKGLSPLKFQFSREGCRVNDDLVPEYAVAYDENAIRQLCTEQGFSVQALHYGAWCGRSEYLSYQDVLIVRKCS
jgi:SAM-dependent methyltransferase